MTKEIRICDVCGKETQTLHVVRVPVRMKPYLHCIHAEGYELCDGCTVKFADVCKEFFTKKEK